MGSIANVVRALIQANASSDQILAAVEDIEQTQKNKFEHLKKLGRERSKKRRKLMPKNWHELCALVFRRDGHICAYCGVQKGNFHIDHISPLSKGGANELENLTVACSSCNGSKGNKSLSEWRQL